MEMVDSVHELKTLRSVASKNFPNLELLDARIASALNNIFQNSHFKKKVSLDEHEAQKEDRFLRGRQIGYMIYDYFRATGAHDTVLDYADLFSITLCNDNAQDFDTRWDEIPLSITKIPSDDVLESVYRLRTRESDQVKTVPEVYGMEIHQKISMPNYQNLKTMVKRSIDQKLRSRNFEARNEKIETGAVVTSRRVNVVLEEDKVFPISGKHKVSVQKDTNAVSGTRVTIVQNRHQKPFHPLSQQHLEVEVHREKGASEAEASLGSPTDSRAKPS